MKTIAEQFYDYGVVPVVVLEDAKDALPLAKALTEGGLPCAEVTFRTDAAEESIRLICRDYPDMLVGAGTVLGIDQAERALEAGAKFIVSPVFPGCITPSEVAQAVKRGMEVLKFFPAEQAGGLAMIKAMAAPYTMVKFMPTGGISEKNLKEYLECDKIICCGGSWMVKGSLIKNGEFGKIRKLVKEAVELVASIRGKEKGKA